MGRRHYAITFCIRIHVYTFERLAWACKRISSEHLKTLGENVHKLWSGERIMSLDCIYQWLGIFKLCFFNFRQFKRRRKKESDDNRRFIHQNFFSGHLARANTVRGYHQAATQYDQYSIHHQTCAEQTPHVFSRRLYGGDAVLLVEVLCEDRSPD